MSTPTSRTTQGVLDQHVRPTGPAKDQDDIEKRRERPTTDEPPVKRRVRPMDPDSTSEDDSADRDFLSGTSFAKLIKSSNLDLSSLSPLQRHSLTIAIADIKKKACIIKKDSVIRWKHNINWTTTLHPSPSDIDDCVKLLAMQAIQDENPILERKIRLSGAQRKALLHRLLDGGSDFLVHAGSERCRQCRARSVQPQRDLEPFTCWTNKGDSCAACVARGLEDVCSLKLQNSPTVRNVPLRHATLAPPEFVLAPRYPQKKLLPSSSASKEPVRTDLKRPAIAAAPHILPHVKENEKNPAAMVANSTVSSKRIQSHNAELDDEQTSFESLRVVLQRDIESEDAKMVVTRWMAERERFRKVLAEKADFQGSIGQFERWSASLERTIKRHINGEDAMELIEGWKFDFTTLMEKIKQSEH